MSDGWMVEEGSKCAERMFGRVGVTKLVFGVGDDASPKL
jgi:hypothetical protein